jgi:hypothetical protein
VDEGTIRGSGMKHYLMLFGLFLLTCLMLPLIAVTWLIGLCLGPYHTTYHGYGKTLDREAFEARQERATKLELWGEHMQTRRKQHHGETFR